MALGYDALWHTLKIGAPQMVVSWRYVGGRYLVETPQRRALLPSLQQADRDLQGSTASLALVISSSGHTVSEDRVPALWRSATA
jgi:hypothetical protein